MTLVFRVALIPDFLARLWCPSPQSCGFWLWGTHDLFRFPACANLSENPHQKAAVVRLAGHWLTNGPFKVCWQILRCCEPYWSQKLACCMYSLCGHEEVVSHGPNAPTTRLFSWQGEQRWSLCGIIKPRKTLKIPLNFHILLAVEMYNLLGGENSLLQFFFPIALTSEAT